VEFRVFVIFTDWDADRVGQDSCFGSVSCCGAHDIYPDPRPMGSPLDPSFPFSISDTATGIDQIAIYDISIPCTQL